MVEEGGYLGVRFICLSCIKLFTNHASLHHRQMRPYEEDSIDTQTRYAALSSCGETASLARLLIPVRQFSR